MLPHHPSLPRQPGTPPAGRAPSRGRVGSPPSRPAATTSGSSFPCGPGPSLARSRPCAPRSSAAASRPSPPGTRASARAGPGSTTAGWRRRCARACAAGPAPPTPEGTGRTAGCRRSSHRRLPLRRAAHSRLPLSGSRQGRPPRNDLGMALITRLRSRPTRIPTRIGAPLRRAPPLTRRRGQLCRARTQVARPGRRSGTCWAQAATCPRPAPSGNSSGGGRPQPLRAGARASPARRGRGCPRPALRAATRTRLCGCLDRLPVRAAASLTAASVTAAAGSVTAARPAGWPASARSARRMTWGLPPPAHTPLWASAGRTSVWPSAAGTSPRVSTRTPPRPPHRGGTRGQTIPPVRGRGPGRRRPSGCAPRTRTPWWRMWAAALRRRTGPAGETTSTGPARTVRVRRASRPSRPSVPAHAQAHAEALPAHAERGPARQFP